MRIVSFFAIAGCWLALATPARAEVVSASASGFELRHIAEIDAPANRVWRDIGWIGRWWSGEHTYSGDASNLRLAPRAGGCWCESWGDGNSIEHARVIFASPNRMLRLDGALGPLQELGVTGILAFALAEESGRTRLTLTYRVVGGGSSNLAAMAPLVDQVLGQQFARLERFSETGAAE